MPTHRAFPGAWRSPATTRRGFLRLSGATAAVCTLAQLRVLPLAAVGCAGDAPGERFFDDAETEILTQLMERVVETGLPDAPRVRDTHAVATVDALCRSLDPAVSGVLPLALGLLEWSPLLFDARLSRFTRLSADGQDATLRSFAGSRFALRRMAFLGLRNLCFMGWYSQPEVWPLVGYQGPLLRRAPAGGAPS
jgi:hypothetical protein